MIDISDPKALEILSKKYGFGFTKQSDQIFTPGFVVKAKKGYGSTSFVLSNFPGSQLIFSYDGQTEVIRRELAKRDPTILERVKVIDLYASVFNTMGMDDKSLLEAGHKICKYVLEILKIVRADHIVHERISILNDRVDKYARYEHFGNYETSLTMPVTGNDIRMYGIRNRFYDELVALTFAKSNVCPVVTTYPAKDFGETFKGRKNSDPEWEINFMAHFRNVIDIQVDRKSGKGNNRYYAILESMKGTDFGETGEEFDITDYKVIFPPEKFEKYRKGNPFVEVKSPVKSPVIEGEDILKDVDTAKENLDNVIEGKKEEIFDDIF